MPEPHILAWAGAEHDIDALHAERFGRAFRRISRYVKLAQVGSSACLDGFDRARLDPVRTGVFMGSGLGNTADIVPLAHGILDPDKVWASPMAFAGCVGNAAAFHVARTLGLEGPNVTVSDEELSFEGAMLEALSALTTGEIDHALVGGVDVRTGSDDDQRARMDARGVPGRVSEGTGWVLLGAGEGPTVTEAWIGPADRLFDRVDTGDAAPGWRVDEPCGRPREERLVPVATAMRLVEDLSAGRVARAYLQRRGARAARLRIAP
jgi:hypothetical protein